MGIEVASSFTRKAAVPLDDATIIADLTARDAIDSGIRYEGMIVYVTAEATNFQLVGGIANENWQELSGAGGGGTGAHFVKGVAPEGNDDYPGAIEVTDNFWKRVFELEYGLDNAILFIVDVPDSYEEGTNLVLQTKVTGSGSENYAGLQLDSYLLKAGVTLQSDDTNYLSRYSGDFQLEDEGVLQNVRLNMCNGSGETEVAIEAGDRLLCFLFRTTPSGTADTEPLLIEKTAEVLYGSYIPD